MSESRKDPESTRDQLARDRTVMAVVRTEFALMRTGFTIASFGTAVTQLLGHGNWNPWITDGLTIAFVLLGMIVIQSAVAHYRVSQRRYGAELEPPLVSGAARSLVPWGLQIALFSVLVLVVAY